MPDGASLERLAAARSDKERAGLRARLLYATLAGVAPGHVVERAGLAIVFDAAPQLIADKAGNVVGIDAMVRVFRQGHELRVDPHRILINPPLAVPDGDGVREDPAEAYLTAVVESLREHPNPSGWRTKGTVTTIFSATADGHAFSSNATWAGARDGPATFTNATNTTTHVGADLNGGLYDVYQTFLSFDTSSIPDGDTIATVALELNRTGLTAADGAASIEVRPYDWGAAIDTSDFRSMAQLNALTLLATSPSSDWGTSGYKAFTENGSNFRSAINKTGTTYLVLNHSFQTANTTPTGVNLFSFNAADASGTTIDPKITITHESPVVPTTATLTLATFAPRVGQGYVPGTASLTLTGFAPTIIIDANRRVFPTPAALAITTFAPTVLAPRLVVPGTAALTLTRFAPPIGHGFIPTPASLTLATFAPTVGVRPVPSGFGRIRVDVYDASGAKLSFGAITSVLSFSYRMELDRIGSFSMEMPADDQRSGYLAQGYELAFYREGEGLVFRGLVEQLDWQIRDGSYVLVVSGGSIARKLAWSNSLLGRTFNGSTLSSAMSTVLSGTGWTAGTLAVPSFTALARFDGVSAWEMALKLAEIFGLHVREDNINKELDVAAFGTSSGIVLQNVDVVSPTLRENTNLFPIAEVEVVEESSDLWNRIIPVGAGEGLNMLTLRYSTRSSPYTIQSATGPDGATYYYIADATSETAYGSRVKVLKVKDAIPVANSSAGFQNAANALYDVAVTWLQRHKDARAAYSVKPVGLKHIRGSSPDFQVGDTMRLIYNGVVKDIDGTQRRWKHVDANVFVMGFERSIQQDGSDDWQLQVSTLDRHVEDDAERMAQAFQAMHALQVALRNYTFRDSYILQRTSMDASNTAQLTVKWDANIALVHKVMLTFVVRALRSNVKTIEDDGGTAPTTSAGGATTSSSGGSSSPTTSAGGSSAPTTSSGGSQTPTSAGGSAHRHMMFQTGSDATSISVLTPSVASTGLQSAGHTHNETGGTTGTENQNHDHSLSSHTHEIPLDKMIAKDSAAGTNDRSFYVPAFHPNNQDIYTHDAESSHTHTVTISAHTHTVTISDHTHSVTISAHTHTVGDHTHTVTVPAHNHDLEYGIFNDTTPTNPAITVTINGVSRTVALGGPWNTVGSEVTVDITQYLQTGATEIPLQQSNPIVFGASVLCDIEAIVRADLTRSALLPV